MPPAFSVVVPVYNSAEILPQLSQRLDVVFEELGLDYELLLIDDNSADRSWEAIRTLQAKRTNIRGLRLTRNFGQHNALMCGFRHCSGEYVVTLDDDLQNPPEEIPRLFRKMLEGDYDVVFGFFRQREHSVLRNLTSNLARRLISRSVARLNPHYSNYRLIRRKIVDELTLHEAHHVYVDGLISWVTDHTTHVEVAHHRRPSGRSNYSLASLIRYFTTILLTFTVLPLRALTLAGSIFSIVGFGLAVLFVLLKLTGYVTQVGFAGIIVSVLFLGGVQLLSLSLLGEYVARIFLRQYKKPQYVVREHSQPIESSTPPLSTTGP